MMTPADDARMIAAVDLLQRTGAQAFRIGYSHEDDGPPSVWYAVAQWVGGNAEAAGALDPVTAALRLCEQVIDGEECAHRHQHTIFLPDADDAGPLGLMGCLYQWDPELATFRRSCEGDHE